MFCPSNVCQGKHLGRAIPRAGRTDRGENGGVSSHMAVQCADDLTFAKNRSQFGDIHCQSLGTGPRLRPTVDHVASVGLGKTVTGCSPV